MKISRKYDIILIKRLTCGDFSNIEGDAFILNRSIHDNCLPVLKALACSTRLDILKLLAKKPYNQQELSELLGVSPAIVSGHIRQLCDAGLVFTEGGEAGRGRQKICYIAQTEFNLKINSEAEERTFRYELPIGLYSRHNVHPSCGLATANRVIGSFDDEMVFLDPLRTEAELLWFNKGYVEYVVPINQNEAPIRKLSISLEMGSEFPGCNNNWPSEITFTINKAEIGSWICPGNYGDRRGKHSPLWWPLNNSQYGLLKTITVDEQGSYIDDKKMSDVTLSQLGLSGSRFYIRFSAKENAAYTGGLTIFGKSFGDYNQDIVITSYY